MDRPKLKRVLVVGLAPMYAHVDVPVEASDEEAIRVADEKGYWMRTLNAPLQDERVESSEPVTQATVPQELQYRSGRHG